MTIYILDFMLKSGDRVTFPVLKYNTNNDGSIGSWVGVDIEHFRKIKQVYHAPLVYRCETLKHDSVVVENIADVIEIDV